MMLKLAAMLIALLTGCATTGVRMQPSEVGAAVDAWRDAGMPYGDECREQRDDVHVVVADGALFADLCRRQLQPGHFESCSIGPLIVVGPAYDLPGYRAHELLHWLQFCSGMPVDYGHANTTIWGRPDGLLPRLGG